MRKGRSRATDKKQTIRGALKTKQACPFSLTRKIPGLAARATTRQSLPGGSSTSFQSEICLLNQTSPWPYTLRQPFSLRASIASPRSPPEDASAAIITSSDHTNTHSDSPKRRIPTTHHGLLPLAHRPCRANLVRHFKAFGSKLTMMQSDQLAHNVVCRPNLLDPPQPVVGGFLPRHSPHYAPRLRPEDLLLVRRAI